MRGELKMSKKSIAELERYEDFLLDLKDEITQATVNNVFDVGEVDHYDMVKNLEKLEAMQDAFVILRHEIRTATLSNSITYNNEEMSLYQAELFLERMKTTRSHYERLREILWISRENTENIKFRQQTIGESALTERIETLMKSIHQLENKLSREKGKIFVEIDIDLIIPASLIETAES